MRIKIFIAKNGRELEDLSNDWLQKNEENCTIIDIIYLINQTQVSVLIKYKK